MKACSIQFSHSVMSDSLQPHGLQQSRLLCPSPTPGVCPSSQWCHSTISSSVVPFSCLQSFPASGSFLMSQFFTLGGQSIRASASSSVLPPSEYSGLTSLGFDRFDLPTVKPWKNIEYLLLGERSQCEKVVYCIIPIIWHSEKVQNYGYRKTMSGSQVLEGMNRKSTEYF